MATAIVFALVVASSSSSATKDPSIVVVDVVVDSRGDNIIPTSDEKFASIKFEISGKVQGVYFRQHTKDKADELGFRGWCRNTSRKTVEGEYEYDISREQTSSSSFNERGVEESQTFRHWLCNVGSPKSRIDGCTFSDRVVSSSRKFEDFRVVK
eukprot:CAMPEP_0181082258 /NCGR_PEP_ID=MMETSP1071-20121207/3525_1 /TAXON_ID=35127 /ORGANISM="Thalassiosira sp., Strain NH16" /LENGTH=153 /DNA_ID=CAMNT_0023163831 /DNA_START=49 /DNA_END=510 /DNA_ORIENTATION=+